MPAKFKDLTGFSSAISRYIVMSSEHQYSLASPYRAKIVVSKMRNSFPRMLLGLAKNVARRGIYASRPLLGKLPDRLIGRAINAGKTRFIAPDLTIAEFFTRLNERKVSYVALRWFEQLPAVEPGHDIDLLIADDDVERIEDLLTYWPGGQPVDVYSETGLPGFQYAPSFLKPKAPHEMAAFPPHLARRLLEDAVRHKGLFRVPNERDHFFSLAYHAVYLKGSRSGLRSNSSAIETSDRGSHDYAAVLAELGRKIGISLPNSPTLEDLDDVLAEHGWRPPLDVLEKISVWSPWVAQKFFSSGNGSGMADPPGIAAFFMRERAVLEGRDQEILNILEARGFELLLVTDIDPSCRDAISKGTRGGNWGPGPYKVSGGLPARFVVGLDLLPIRVRRDALAMHPLLDNERVLTAKTIIRSIINRGRQAKECYNAVHSSDNSRQAWEAIRAVVPEQADRLAVTARERMRSFSSDGAVEKDLTEVGNRARVELIRWQNGYAVRKTFKPNCLKFLRREVAVLTDLSGSPHVPKILETGENYFVIEYFANAWDWKSRKLLPLKFVRQLAEFTKSCAACGYDPIDFKPRGNLLLDPERGLKVIDFEFWYRRAEAFPPEHAYAFAGIPQDFEGDAPVWSEPNANPYRTEWRPFTGMDLHTFLHAPPWLQRWKRLWNYPVIFLRALILDFLRNPTVIGFSFGVSERLFLALRGLRRWRSRPESQRR